MSEIIAKPVVKNKFWIVESGGIKIATIQAIDEGGVAYVHDQLREVFPSIKLLSKKYNISFVKAEKPTSDIENEYTVYGYPVSEKPHNEVLDVQRYLPIYSKENKSRSFYCAGYYIVKLTDEWTECYCPKLITLNRYEYQGPFKTKERMLESLTETNGQ
jgi:hypothetical protein